MFNKPKNTSQNRQHLSVGFLCLISFCVCVQSYECLPKSLILLMYTWLHLSSAGVLDGRRMLFVFDKSQLQKHFCYAKLADKDLLSEGIAFKRLGP